MRTKKELKEIREKYKNYFWFNGQLLKFVGDDKFTTVSEEETKIARKLWEDRKKELRET